ERVHHRAYERDDWGGRQRQPRRLVRVVMAVGERLVARGVLERIDAERVLVGDRPHQIESRVLVPAAGLIEVGVRREEQHEQRDPRPVHTTLGGGAGRRDSPTISIAMLTTSPATVAKAAPSGP